MTTLPTQFTESGFTHEQIAREGDVCLYRRGKTGSEQFHFEVIRLRRHNGFTVPGKDIRIDPGETYPSAHQWGVRGWTFNQLDKAQEKFQYESTRKLKGRER